MGRLFRPSPPQPESHRPQSVKRVMGRSPCGRHREFTADCEVVFDLDDGKLQMEGEVTGEDFKRGKVVLDVVDGTGDYDDAEGKTTPPNDLSLLADGSGDPLGRLQARPPFPRAGLVVSGS